MPKGHREEGRDEGVLFVRGMPRDLSAKLKAAAALNRQTLAQYLVDLCAAHVQELEKKGLLPKGK